MTQKNDGVNLMFITPIHLKTGEKVSLFDNEMTFGIDLTVDLIKDSTWGKNLLCFKKNAEKIYFIQSDNATLTYLKKYEDRFSLIHPALVETAYLYTLNDFIDKKIYEPKNRIEENIIEKLEEHIKGGNYLILRVNKNIQIT